MNVQAPSLVRELGTFTRSGGPLLHRIRAVLVVEPGGRPWEGRLRGRLVRCEPVNPESFVALTQRVGSAGKLFVFGLWVVEALVTLFTLGDLVPDAERIPGHPHIARLE